MPLYRYLLDSYSVGKRLCISVIRDGEVYGKLSVNIPDSLPLEPNEFWAKTYSENAAWAPALLLSGPFERIEGKIHNSAYITAPCYKLTNAFIKEQFELTYNSKSDIYEASETLFNLHERYCK